MLVVVPTLGRREDTLATALASVHAQEGVTVRLVVVVPREAANARTTAAGFGATVNAGVAARRDEELYAWLGDDDLLEPGGLRTLAALLRGRRDAVVVYGACRYIDPRDRTITVSRAGRLASAILGFGPDLVPQPASLTRLDAMQRAGEYDESLHYAMDLDMFLRLRRLVGFVSTGTEVASFRWHADSLTVANRGPSLAESERVKRRYLRPVVRPFSPAWDVPVRLATRLAVRRWNAMTTKLDAAR